MSSITVFRRLIEDLESCGSFNMEESREHITVIFYCANPVDSIIWMISKSYFKKHFKKFFDMEIEKMRAPDLKEPA